MNTEKLNYAMQYVDDDLLMEFFETDDRLKVERTAALQRHLKIFVAVVCAVLIVVLAGVTVYKRMIKIPEEGITVNDTEFDLSAVPVLLNHEKYQMFEDSRVARKLLAEHGYTADDGADILGEEMGYLDKAADTVDGRLCFTFSADKTNYVLYACRNTARDDLFILQSGEGCYLLIKDGIVN